MNFRSRLVWEKRRFRLFRNSFRFSHSISAKLSNPRDLFRPLSFPSFYLISTLSIFSDSCSYLSIVVNPSHCRFDNFFFFFFFLNSKLPTRRYEHKIGKEVKTWGVKWRIIIIYNLGSIMTIIYIYKAAEKNFSLKANPPKKQKKKKFIT